MWLDFNGAAKPHATDTSIVMISPKLEDKDSKYGAVDINNRLVLPFEYDDIRFDIDVYKRQG